MILEYMPFMYKHVVRTEYIYMLLVVVQSFSVIQVPRFSDSLLLIRLFACPSSQRSFTSKWRDIGHEHQLTDQ